MGEEDTTAALGTGCAKSWEYPAQPQIGAWSGPDRGLTPYCWTVPSRAVALLSYISVRHPGFKLVDSVDEYDHFFFKTDNQYLFLLLESFASRMINFAPFIV